jgi:hypothetical protein
MCNKSLKPQILWVICGGDLLTNGVFPSTTSFEWDVCMQQVAVDCKSESHVHSQKTCFSLPIIHMREYALPKFCFRRVKRSAIYCWEVKSPSWSRSVKVKVDWIGASNKIACSICSRAKLKCQWIQCKNWRDKCNNYAWVFLLYFPLGYK